MPDLSKENAQDGIMRFFEHLMIGPRPITITKRVDGPIDAGRRLDGTSARKEKQTTRRLSRQNPPQEVGMQMAFRYGSVLFVETRARWLIQPWVQTAHASRASGSGQGG
jgi:hypothetical protein